MTDRTALAELERVWNENGAVGQLGYEIAQDTAIELRLAETGLTSLPDAVWQLEHLSRVYIYGNPITTVSHAIGRMRDALVLDLGHIGCWPFRSHWAS